MPLKVVKCGLTADTSNIYIDEIKQYAAQDSSKQLILMVPDRFSYIAEKLVCEHLGGFGFGGVQVLTLHQLIRDISGSDAVLSSVGKQMLLKRIINHKLDENSVFYGAKDKTGFVENVLDVMNDWKRFCVNYEALKEDIKTAPSGLTCRKLTDLAEIYKAYTDVFNKKGYKDESDLLADAAEVIKCGGFDNTVLWIDGFVEFVPAEINVISSFLSIGADVRIYLPCKKGTPPEKGEVYYVPEQTLSQIFAMCRENGYQYSVEEIETCKKMERELAFLCDTYDDRDKVFDGECNSIVIKQADDIYSEVEYAASEIIDLVCDGGFKFSDISVLCGNLSSYSSCIEAVFERYSIPYFSDYKLPLSNHPVSILLMSVFDIVEKKSFPSGQVIRYLKTGYIISSEDDVDFLSLFIRKYSIRGNMWNDNKYFEVSTGNFFDEAMGKEAKKLPDSEKLVKLREQVARPLMSYYENSKGKKTANEHIKAFFDYLQEIELFKKIQLTVDEFEKNGEENEASRLTHVWNIIVNLFDQMVIALGDEKLTRGAFGEYLKAGIEGSEISIIPTVTNGVSVSDAGHRNGSEIKALFVLGATRDTVPAIKREDGLFSEDELGYVSSLPSSVGKMKRNQSKEFELITAFSETSDFLCLSWCKTGMSGEKEEKSQIFDLLMSKFPRLKFPEINNETFISSPKSMIHKLLVRISSGEELSPYYECVKDWFSEKEEWKNSFELLDCAEKYKMPTGSIQKDISARLYENLTQYSVSRLEKYFQCPFMYFAANGLCLDDGEDCSMKSTDTGSLVHHALAEFCIMVEEGAETAEEKSERWKCITDDKRKEYVSRIMNDIIEKSGISVEEQPKMESIFGRIESVVDKASEIVALMLLKGKYRIYGNEMYFDNYKVSGDRGEINFHGIIDRIDVLENDGKISIRIVDYKTGEKSFDFADALNGIDLQLIIYAMAAESLAGENSEISGFFYNSLKKKIVSAEDAAAVAKEVKKLYKLSGVVVEEGNDVKTGSDMDCDLTVVGESEFLPLKLKKDGSYTANSAVEVPGFMSEIYRNVKNIAAAAAADIENGDVRVYPYVTKSKDSCRFCPYSSLCMYDLCSGAEINDGEKGKKLLEEIKSNNRIG